MRIGASEAVFNEDSNDYDFRVESDVQANTLFVEGSSGNVSVGSGTPVPSASNYDSACLHIRQTGSSNVGAQLRFTTGQTGHNANDGSFIAQWEDLNVYLTNQEAGGWRFFAGSSASGLNKEVLSMDSHNNGIVFNDTDANIDFRIESDSDANMFFVDAGNNRVGIGTNAPSHALDIVESVDDFAMRITNNSDGSKGLQVRVSDNDSGENILELQSSNSATGTDYTNRLRIAKNGIPTFLQSSTNTDAESDLGCFAHFRNTNAAVNTGFTITLGSNDNSGTGIYARRIGSNNEHEMGFQVRNSSGSSVTRAMIHATAQFTVNTKLKTVNSSSAHIIALNDGNMGAMNIATDATSSRTGIVFTNTNGTVGSITMSGTTTTYNTSSDYRLKENIVTDWDATSRLKQLKPSRFNFKTDKDLTVDGFLAHEVSSIVPEAVTGTKDETEKISNVVLNADGTVLTHSVSKEKWEADKLPTTDADGNEEEPLYSSDTTWVESKIIPKYQGIDQSKLVPLLVKTIQELEARIAKLEGE
jgi:hypothetical protein